MLLPVERFFSKLSIENTICIIPESKFSGKFTDSSILLLSVIKVTRIFKTKSKSMYY